MKVTNKQIEEPTFGKNAWQIAHGHPQNQSLTKRCLSWLLMTDDSKDYVMTRKNDCGNVLALAHADPAHIIKRQQTDHWALHLSKIIRPNTCDIFSVETPISINPLDGSNSCCFSMYGATTSAAPKTISGLTSTAFKRLLQESMPNASPALFAPMT